MARVRFNITGGQGSIAEDAVTRIAAITTLITAASTARALIATDRTAQSETNATVTTDVTACQTAITAVQTAVTALSTSEGAPVVVDVDLGVITTLDALNTALAAAVQRFRERGLA